MNAATAEILLVEDNPIDAELMLRAFRASGLADRVFLVQGGEEAVEFVLGTGRHSGRSGARAPKVVVLDLKLPKMDGLAVLFKLKGDERTRAIPVVVLTASTAEEDVLRSYRLGVNSYVVKPSDYGQYVKVVSRLGEYWISMNRPPERC